MIQRASVYFRRILFPLLSCFLPLLDMQMAWGQFFPNPSGKLSIDEGLSQNSVNDLFQDSEGYLWLATGDGLNRYDGKEVRQYFVPRKPGAAFASNLIRGSVVEDSKNRIWFGTQDGFYFIDKQSDSVVLAENLIEKKWYLAVFQFRFCHKDSIWFSNPISGFGYYAITTRKFGFLPFPEAPDFNSPLNFKISGSYPFLWYCNPSQKKVYGLDCRTKKYQLVFQSEKPIRYFIDAGDEYLLVSENRLWKLSKGEKEKLLVSDFGGKLRSKFISRILRDSFGRIWLASVDQGLFMADPATGMFWHSAEKANEIPSAIVTCLLTDRWNMLWVGTDGGGAVSIDLNPPLFRRFPAKKEAEKSGLAFFTKCLMEDHDGNIWFGTHQDGITILSPGGLPLRSIRSASGKPLQCIGALLQDSLNQVWIGHGNGVLLFHPDKNLFEEVWFDMPEKPLGNTNFIFKFCSAAHGQMLCATDYGLFQIRREKDGSLKARELQPKAAKFPVQLKDIVATGDNRFLISAPPFGVFETELLGDECKVHRIFMKGVETRSLLPAEDFSRSGICRVATNSGLALLNVKTGGFRLLGNKNGLINEHIYGMLPDTRGNLWISSNQGLFLFDTRTEQFRHFTAVSGLQSNEFNSGAFSKGKSGRLYFGGIHGINWFEPERFYAEAKAPLAVLSDYFVNGKRRAKSATGLDFDQNDLRFIFSAIDFSSAQGNKIRYCLRGWDENPVFTENREAIYNNLSPGTYRLEYEACNARGVWSKLNSYSFTIHPPFWKTIWFYLFSGASGLTLLIFCIRYYEKRKLAEQLRKAEQQRLLSEERLRISSEMHDDIGAGLTRISLMTEAARRSSDGKEELMDNIGQTSRKLVESMGEIIWSMSEESRSPEQVLAYIREMVSKQLEYSTIRPEFRFGLDNKAILLSNHQKRSLILMVKELVNNAIKYSGADSIRIDISIENSGLSVEVKDNGCGFSGEIHGLGNGLKNLKTKVEKLGGTFKTGNEQGAWVRVCIALN